MTDSYKGNELNVEQLHEDDGLSMSEVGSWAVTKHSKIGYYAELFAASMKRKWDCRVYLDLFSGAGKSRIKGKSNVIPGSPLKVLNIKDPFDKYIFCEQDTICLDALEKRVNTYFPDLNCSFIAGDTNEKVNDILDAIPHFSSSFKGLTFCLVDPFNCSQIKYETIKSIADSIYVDFLILIPSYMDINRNEQPYTENDNICLDEYLGTSEWRDEWFRKQKKDYFGLFIAEKFCMQMKKLNYLYEKPEDMELIKMGTGKNLPLYHLAFFSRSELGLKFWRNTKKGTNIQTSLF